MNADNGLDKWIHFDKYAGTDITVRKAKLSDNRNCIAKLLYHTDPYIYPAAFGSEDKAISSLSKLYSIPGNLFSYQNIYVAVKSEKIIGVAVVIQESMEESLEQFLDKSIVGVSFHDVTEKYFDKVFIEAEDSVVILCLSVNPNYQGQRAGRQLLSHIVSDSECITKNVKLDVLADNFGAIKLYEECGFIVENKTYGYAFEEDKPQVFEMKRKAEMLFRNDK